MVRLMDTLLYTIDQAVDLTGLSRSSLNRLIKSNRLIAVKVGTRRLIPRQSLQRFVDELIREARETAGGLR